MVKDAVFLYVWILLDKTKGSAPGDNARPSAPYESSGAASAVACGEVVYPVSHTCRRDISGFPVFAFLWYFA